MRVVEIARFYFSICFIPVPRSLAGRVLGILQAERREEEEEEEEEERRAGGGQRVVGDEVLVLEGGVVV